MNIDGKRIWQVGSGDTNRNYPRLLLEWDVIAMGPGDAGPWPNCKEALSGNSTSRRVTDLQRFCEGIHSEDLVLLRLGTSEVYGVGQAEGGYLWLDDFGDVDGWDLQHVRRVRWLWKCEDEPQRFPAYTMKFGDTVQLVKDAPELMRWLDQLPEPTQDSLAKPLCSLPTSCNHAQRLQTVELKTIGDHLFDQGVSATFIDSLMSNINELMRIAQWYERTNQQPSEHETVAYLAVPLLRSLGWTPQKMSVEWNYVDVALFERMPRDAGNLAVAVEAKKRGDSCITARSKAEHYASQPGRSQCHRLIVTDGLRYGVYLKDCSGKFTEHPQAYLNLTRMMDSYPLMATNGKPCGGAKEALLFMAPDWKPGLTAATPIPSGQ
jgi:hypothetical protein